MDHVWREVPNGAQFYWTDQTGRKDWRAIRFGWTIDGHFEWNSAISSHKNNQTMEKKYGKLKIEKCTKADSTKALFI